MLTLKKIFFTVKENAFCDAPKYFGPNRDTV